MAKELRKDCAWNGLWIKEMSSNDENISKSFLASDLTDDLTG
jgi:hypothetical protein